MKKIGVSIIYIYTPIADFLGFKIVKNLNLIPRFVKKERLFDIEILSICKKKENFDTE